MAEAASQTDNQVPESIRNARSRFIELWGQMGSSWGIPRTMAEVHALLYIGGQAMNSEQVMRALNISRGNASMTLRALVDWGLVRRVHLRGDRKDYFEAEQDVWNLFRTVLRERKRREVEPLLESLRRCRETTEPLGASRKLDPKTAQVEAHNGRVESLIMFISMVDAMCDELISPTGKAPDLFAKLLERAS